MPGYAIRTILAATDFSSCSRKALAHAVALARTHDARLVLQHAYEIPTGLSAASLVPAGEELQVPLRDYLHATADAQLAEQERTLTADGVRATRRLDEGRAHLAIVAAAEAEGADLIVIGTHGRTGLTHLLLGSTAERVIRQAPCPVLVVREPEGAAPAPRVGEGEAEP